MIYNRLNIDEIVYNSLKSELSNLLIKIHKILNDDSYESEDAYFTGLIACLKMCGKIKFGQNLFIEFKTSKTNDKGAHCAENLGGCDLGMVVDWVDGGKVIFSKGIIGQAKNHTKLSAEERKNLKTQCDKMRRFTEQSIVLFREKDQPPNIIMAADIKDNMDINKYYANNKISLCDFIIDKVLACFFGDTDKDKIGKMKSSDLGIKYSLSVETNLKPQLKFKPKKSMSP